MELYLDPETKSALQPTDYGPGEPERQPSTGFVQQPHSDILHSAIAGWGRLGDMAADTFRTIVPHPVRDIGGFALNKGEQFMGAWSPQNFANDFAVGPSGPTGPSGFDQSRQRPVPTGELIAQSSEQYPAARLTWAALNNLENPLVAAGLVTAPAPTLGSIAGGIGGTEAARALGGTPGQQKLAGLAGMTIGGFAGAKLPEGRVGVSPSEPPLEPVLAGPEPPSPPTASQRLYNLGEQPSQGLTWSDALMNSLKERTGIGTPENESATPIMRERMRVRSVADSQANLMGAIANDITREFPMDKQGRLGLPGSPTIADLAARYPEYEPLLTDAQRAGMERLKAAIEPYSQAMAEHGIDTGSRSDIQDGGFYLPRGRADLEGADAPVKIGSGGGRAGTKKGFERGAVFDSQSQGIDAGYEYAPLSDALQSYARDAAHRVIDQWAANQLKATGLGEGVRERLIRQQPELVNEWDNLNKDLVSVRAKLATAESRAGLNIGKADELDRALAETQRAQPKGGAAPLGRIPTMMQNEGERAGGLFASGLTERGKGVEQVLSKLDDLVPDGTERIRFLDTAIARTERRLDTLAGRGQQYSSTVEDLRDTLADLKRQHDNLAPEYRRAVKRAQSTPRDQGSIGFAGLNGTTFPNEVANAANKYLNAEKPPTGRGTGVVTAAHAFNGLMRGLKASTDISFTAIQGLLGAVNHPIQYAQAMRVAIQSLGDSRAFGAFVSDFDVKTSAAGRPTSQDWVAAGTRVGGTDTEFAIGRGLKRVGPAVQNAPIVKQSNRAFGVFGDTLRLSTDDALFEARQNAGKPVGAPEMADISKFSNLMTGWSQRRFLGDTGDLIVFAPRFFQSQLDLVGNALTDTGIVGQQARLSLVKLIGTGTLLTFAANEARGKPTSFNPTDPNFMRIRDVFGQDVSLFGPWDSLVRGISSAAGGDMTYISRSKASPLVALAWDEISGKSFTGDNTRTPEYLLRSLLPFSLSNVGQPGQTVGGTLVGLTGTKATPLSPTDYVQAGEYKQLSGDEQFKAIKSQAWKVMNDQPAFSKGLAGFNSEYEWAQSILDHVRQTSIDNGRTPAEAEMAAQSALLEHPSYKAYLALRDQLTTRWVAENPADAIKKWESDSGKPFKDSTKWTPTKQQVNMMEQYIHRQPAPVGAQP